MDELREMLIKKIMTLNENVWERRLSETKIDNWLNNFIGKVGEEKQEKLHALYWLSQFMYFGGKEIRVLLKSLYRDLVLYPIIQEKRVLLGEAASLSDIELAVADEIEHTRFMGVGNPSESGVHLLYFFRQENNLPKTQFLDSMQIFSRSNSTVRGRRGRNGHLRSNTNLGRKILRFPKVRRYVFLDDMCGTGETAIDYSNEIVSELILLNPRAKVSYCSIFATKSGIDAVRKKSLFRNHCGAVYELDDTYRCLSPESRFLSKLPPEISPDLARKIVTEYGALLDPRYASGYKNSQMLMGFHHNTPDNTIGIIWHDSLVSGGQVNWTPIFKRYPKIYGEP